MRTRRVFGVSAMMIGAVACHERPSGVSSKPGAPATTSARPAATDTATTSSTAREIATGSAAEAFHDLTLAIERRERNEDGSQTLVVAGAHHGVRVGFELWLGANWRAKDLGDGLVMRGGTVTLRRRGAESDAFVKALDEIYATRQSPRSMRESAAFSGVSLAGNPGALDQGLVEIKLFFEGKGEAEYGELFLNIDAAARRVELAEKDEGYRRPLIRALSQP